MRQFLLAGSGAYPSQLPLTAGQLAITILKNGVETIDSDGTTIEDVFYINLKKASGDTVVIPASPRHFSFVKGEYKQATKYSGEVTIPAPNFDGNFTLVFVKKGMKFNERNRWTSTVPVKVGDTGEGVAAKLVKFFENNATSLNIRATVAGAKITINGLVGGEDFVLMGADDILGINVSETHAEAGYGSAEYIKDLANKAAADAGFLYTYEELDINPGYPLNPLAKENAEDTGYTIFTLRFAVPRHTKTRDELVHQIVQIAYPTGSAAIETVEAIFTELVAFV